MPSPEVVPLRDLEDAAKAYERVRTEIEAQDPKNLSAYNVDIPNAASIAPGVAPRIVVLRNRAAALPNLTSVAWIICRTAPRRCGSCT